MSRYTPTRDEVNLEALASQRRAEAEDAFPAGQGYDAVYDWRQRQMREIAAGMEELNNVLNPMRPNKWRDFEPF